MLLTVLGIIAVTTLLRCPSGPGAFGSCFTSATTAIGGTMKAAATEGEPPSIDAALTVAPAPAAAPTPDEAGTGWVEALIAGSFDQLPAEPGRTAVAATPESGADEVTTGSIAARPVVAAGPEAPVSSPAGEEVASADPAIVLPSPRIDDTRREAVAAAAADDASATWTVGGRGVNVRSGPSKSNRKLFALAAGEELRVTQNKRGWLRVVDERGRAGWAYSSYLVKP